MTIMQVLSTAWGAILCGLATALAIMALVPIWDHFAVRLMAPKLARMRELNIDPYPVRIGLRVWGLMMVLTFVTFWWGLNMPPIAVTLTWLVYVAAGYVLDAWIEIRSRILRDQMVAAALGLASAMRASQGIATGLETVARETPAPLAHEFRRIVADFHYGRPLTDALAAAQSRLRTESFILFASALQVAVDRGGRINEALARISFSLQEHQRLERKIQADTASGRRMVQILAICPFAFLALLQLAAPDQVHALSATFIGQLVLAAAILIDYAGVRMAMRLVNVRI